MTRRADAPLLSKQDVNRAYKQALQCVSIIKGTVSDETRQAMADAIHEFYRILAENIETKVSH
jgi:histone H3/H4